jgi:ribosome-binding protein aMBF1 (putative translation factor)
MFMIKEVLMHDKITLKNKKYVLVPEAEYRKLMGNGQKMPGLPAKNARGHYPALAAAEATIARTIVKRRLAAGLSQRALAGLAGIRVETLNRAERGTVTPDVRTLQRIERALERAESAPSSRVAG